MPTWSPLSGDTMALGIGVLAMLTFVGVLLGTSTQLLPVELGVPLMLGALAVFASCLRRDRAKKRPRSESDSQL